MDFNGGVLMQRYELGKLLGQGSFAKVYQGKNIETGASVAIKVIDKKKVMKVGMMKQIEREISVMKLVKHPNIIELYEVMASKNKIYFVLELVKDGELFDKVAKGRLKEDVARKYFQQLICAIGFCHDRGVFHRDLKPENLLLDDEGNLKVTDFGLSALAETKRQDGLLHTSCGTPAYVAPEVIRQKGYDGAKADIWSCGVVLFVLLAGFLPFHDSNLMEMYRKIAKGEFNYPNWFPNEARKLVSKMLDPNPKTRISIKKIMENSWFKKGFVEQQQTTEKAFVLQEKDFNLNAFDIISLSPGFDLSGLFNDEGIEEKEVKFMLKQTVAEIVSKLEVIAESLNLKLLKKNEMLLNMEGSLRGKNGGLVIIFEIFEIAPNAHLVESNRLAGDQVEFQKIINEHIKPALMDIV
ncbi:CBL-interacting protein kinase 2-like [Rutidosis leptorrhynchoides]|uniref:CBL-interacting protein kinase 2-like n=1 Tax=Rutidosis leptorrhynchoides TaxID=125765 RepID=UPI003A98D9BE